VPYDGPQKEHSKVNALTTLNSRFKTTYKRVRSLFTYPSRRLFALVNVEVAVSIAEPVNCLLHH